MLERISFVQLVIETNYRFDIQLIPFLKQKCNPLHLDYLLHIFELVLIESHLFFVDNNIDYPRRNKFAPYQTVFPKSYILNEYKLNSNYKFQ